MTTVHRSVCQLTVVVAALLLALSVCVHHCRPTSNSKWRRTSKLLLRDRRSTDANVVSLGLAGVSDFVSGSDDQDSDDQQPTTDIQLDRHMVVACTNRHNCELTCVRAKAAKFSTKAALLDALSARMGEHTLTDAHKLGIQFGRHKSCDKCALIYSNCDNHLYPVAQRQLFGWSMTPDQPMISYPKSSNTL